MKSHFLVSQLAWKTSTTEFLLPEILWSQNKWFYLSSNALSESIRKTSIINFAPYLIIPLCWFSNQGGHLVQHDNFFSCTQSESSKHLMIPITSTTKYFLIATINHSVLWIEVFTGFLSKTFTHLLGTLAVTSWFLMLRKILSTVLHYTFFLTAKFNFFRRSTKDLYSWVTWIPIKP